MSGASLYDFRDMDVLLKLAREQSMRSDEMAQALGLTGDGSPGRAAGIRLSWMRRYGMVEFDTKARMWRLSPGGERVTTAHLQAAQERTLKDVPDEALVEVMSHVTSRFMLGDPMIAHMLRREFLFGTRPR
jgi:hypothetical protein